MSLFIQNNNGPVYTGCTVNINNYNQPSSEKPAEDPSPVEKVQAEDVMPVDTSFFCTNRFSEDIIVKNIRQVIELSSSKADACRRLMSLETQGYIVLSNVKDERKAELVNPFATPKYTLTGEDFRKARNN